MRRIAELDGLRGIAAIGIVAFHYGMDSSLTRVTYVGVLALELFFVLSGFLISSIILAHAGTRGFVRTFYLRRGLRIWPAYYLFVLVIAVAVLVRPGLGELRALPYYLTFTQNVQEYWFAGAPLLAFPAQLTWSLAVEEQFYILWPLLVGLVGVVFMAPMALAFIGVAIAARFLGLSESLLVTRCDGFAMGGLLAMALAGRRESDSARALNRRLTFVASVCALYLLVVPPLQGYPPCVTHGTPTAPVDIAVASALFAAVIGLVVINQGKRALAPLRARLIVYLGTISYGIYLYHIAAQVCGDAIVSRLGLPRGVSRAAVSPALVLGVSAASWAWLEKPCLRLKDRFGYGRTRIDTALEGPPGPEAAPGAPNQIGPEIETVA